MFRAKLTPGGAGSEHFLVLRNTRHKSSRFSQIELEEQRRTSRGRAKESKRKRKGHRGGAEETGQQLVAPSESKKTCPLSSQLPVQIHPEVPAVSSLVSHFLFALVPSFHSFDRFCDVIGAGGPFGGLVGGFWEAEPEDPTSIIQTLTEQRLYTPQLGRLQPPFPRAEPELGLVQYLLYSQLY